MTTEFFDIAANLSHRSFGGDLPGVVERAKDAGVTRMLVTGTNLSASQKALEIAKRYPGMVSSAGVHPHNAKQWRDDSAAYGRQLARDPSVAAIGECGLDYNRDFSPRQKQRRAFEEQLALAVELGKPVYLHERDAHQDFVAILREHREQLVRGVVHCFTGTRQVLHAYLDLDLHIGLTGWICDERRGAHLRELVRDIPFDRLMIETDAPFILPHNMPLRPKSRRNEPAFLPHVATMVAKCAAKPVEQLARETTETAKAFFAVS